MPRDRPNRRDYVTIQLNRMLGKKSKPVTILDDGENAQGQTVSSEKTGTVEWSPPQVDNKAFRAPSIPSASIADRPDQWRRKEANTNSGSMIETSLANENAQNTPKISITHEETDDFHAIVVNQPMEQVQPNPSRPKWNRQFSYKSAAQEELEQQISDMPPLQVFTEVLRIHRPKKSLNNESFVDVEMWKELLLGRDKFDISEPDIFHYFSQKSQMPESVLVGGKASTVSNPFGSNKDHVLILKHLIDQIQAIIDGHSWLFWSIKARDLNLISYLCRRRQKDVADHLLTDDRLSYKLLQLLLSSNSKSVTKTRVDFFRIVALKFHKRPNDAINYLMKYSVNNNESRLYDGDQDEDSAFLMSTQYTESVVVEAIDEIRSFYPMDIASRLALMAKLFIIVILLSGWLFYMWALVTDIEILYKSFGCNDGTSSHDEGILQSSCLSHEVCSHSQATTPSQGYFYYTLLALLSPFLANAMLVVKQLLKEEKTYSLVEIGFSRQTYLPKMSPIAYRLLNFIWIISLVLFYPIIAKLLYIGNLYRLLKIQRNVTMGNKDNNKHHRSKKEDFMKKMEEQRALSKFVAGEVVASEVVLAVTALSLQPFVQCYSLLDAASFCDLDSNLSIFIAKLIPANTQLRSIVACILGFAFINTTHTIYVKHDNNSLGHLPLKSISARLFLFSSYFCQAVARIIILVYSALYVFETYHHLVLLLVLHVVVMAVIHLIDLYCIKKYSPNILSVGFWLELVLNGCGSIFLPSDFSGGEKVWTITSTSRCAKRFYNYNTTRYLLMYAIIIIESAILLYLSYQHEQARIHILISIGIMAVGMMFHFLYYAMIYPWPLRIQSRPLGDVLCSKDDMKLANYPSLLDNEGQDILINFKVGGLEIEVNTPKTPRTPRTPRSRSRIAFDIPDEETEM